MTKSSASVNWNQAKVASILQAVSSGVQEVTQRLEAAAKANLSPGRGKRTGTLQRDIQARPPIIVGYRVIGRVATGAASRKYALVVHRGRGAIVAKPGKMLRIVLANGDVLYRKRVGPAKAIPYMTDAFATIKPGMRGVLARYIKAVI